MVGSGRPGTYKTCDATWVTVPFPRPIAERILDNDSGDKGLRDLVLDIMAEAKPNWPWPDELVSGSPPSPHKGGPPKEDS